MSDSVLSLNVKMQLYTPGAVEVRAGEDGVRKIAGYAVRWDMLSQPIWDVYLERFAKGSFAQSLITRQNEIYATWQHDVRDTLGRSPGTLVVREDENGLYYEITPPTWAERHLETIERGDVRGSSFTFMAEVAEYDWESDPQYVIRTVKRASLFEVAPVTNPAYLQSTAGVRSGDDAVAGYIRAEREKRKAQFSAYLARMKALRDISIRS